MLYVAAFSAAAGLLGSDGAPRPAPGAGTADGSAAVVERRQSLMGTLLRARVAADRRETAVAASEAVFSAVRAEEALLSTWEDGTALSRLNRAPVGRAVRVPGRLLALLEEAWTWSARLEGAFDPAVGALVEAWDLRGEGRRPAPGRLRRARAASGRSCFELRPAAGEAVRRCEGAWIDAGGFGKGSALRRARRALEGSGAAGALLDFGGQLLALGAPPGGDAWSVTVAHPERRGEPVLRLRVAGRSVATTGTSERGVAVDGRRMGHVLDPRTGRPAPAWGSVTVVARDPMEADLLSTALYVLGPTPGLARARGLEDVGVLFLELSEDGRLRPSWNRAMEAYLPPEDGAPGRRAIDA